MTPSQGQPVVLLLRSDADTEIARCLHSAFEVTDTRSITCLGVEEFDALVLPIRDREQAFAAVTQARPQTNAPLIVLCDGTPQHFAALLDAGADSVLSADSDGELIKAHLRSSLRRAANLKKLERLAQRDPLTGLHNRRATFESLVREIERARRNERNVALLLVDLDGFKQINDQYGHAVGDEALVHVAEQIRHATRTTDVIGRFGGDEFIVVLPECDVQEAQVVAGRIGAAIASLTIASSGQPLGASIGVANSPAGTLTSDQLFVLADRRMYAVKRAHRPAFSHRTAA